MRKHDKEDADADMRTANGQPLSDRAQQERHKVVNLAQRGNSDAEIAEELGLQHTEVANIVTEAKNG